MSSVPSKNRLSGYDAGKAFIFQTLLALAYVLIFANGSAAASESSYHLRPQTQLKITVVEWVASTGEYKEWTALNGEYIVSPVGTISVPLVGEIVVASATTSEVSSQIAGLLKDKTGLVKAPTVTVEVSKYPMLYVMGAVDHPGAVEYRPGLTVMQAVAMAGGRERKSNPQGYSELQQIQYVGDLNQYELRLKQLLARQARLEAEVNGSPTIKFPPELTVETDTAMKEIMNRENLLFAAKAETLKQQLASLDALQSLLQKEIQVLDEKAAVQDRQIKIAQDELAGISSLVDKGTLAKSRETSLERVVADLSSGKLDLVIAAMRARQKLSETERDASNLKGERKTQAGRDLQQVEAEIEDVKLKRNTTMQLLQATGASLARYDARKAIELQPVEYWLSRKDDVRSPIKIEQTTALEPGDVLDVRYDLSPSMNKPLQLSTNFGQIQ